MMINCGGRSTRIAASVVKWNAIALGGLVLVLVLTGLVLPEPPVVEADVASPGRIEPT